MRNVNLIFTAILCASSCSSLFAQTLEITDIKNPSIQCDYLILCPSEFLSSANKLAAFRNQYQFDDVSRAKVITLNTVYSQFPVPDTLPVSCSIWHALKYATEKWSLGPDYIVLLGDDKVEVRGFDSLSLPPKSVGLMPTFYYSADTAPHWTFTGYSGLDTVISYSDFFYMTIGDSTPSIQRGERIYSITSQIVNNGNVRQAFGRIPARTNDECNSYLDKLIRYETTDRYGGWNNTIEIVADDNFLDTIPDPLFHFLFNSAERFSSPVSSSGFFTHKTYLSSFAKSPTGEHINAKRNLFEAINNGTKLSVFFCRGNNDVLADELVVQNSDTALFTNDAKPTMFFGFTSSNGDFLRRVSPQMSSAFLFKTYGGCISYLGSPENTSASTNEMLAINIVSQITDTAPTSLGSVIKSAQNSALDMSSYSYTILGDPAISLRRKNIPITLQALNRLQDSLSVTATVRPPDTHSMKYEFRIFRGDQVRGLDDPSIEYVRDTLLYKSSGKIVSGSVTSTFPASIGSLSGPGKSFKYVLYVWSATGEGRADTAIVLNSGTIANSRKTAAIPAIQMSCKNGLVSFTLPPSIEKNGLSISIFNLKGTLVFKTLLNTRDSRGTISLNDKRIGKGLYFYRLHGNNLDFKGKFMHE